MGRANIYKPTSNDCNVLLTLCSLILTGKHASMCFLRSNFSFASPPSSAFITNSFKSSISLGTEEGWIKSDRVGEVFIFVKTACILPYISELLSCCFMHSLALFTIFFHVCCKSQAHHLRAQINSVLILTMGSQFYSKFATHLPLENCKDSFVCTGDCGGTAFEGGSPRNAQIKVWNNKKQACSV